MRARLGSACSASAGGHRLSCRLMIGDILQPTHLIFILVIALLVLGPKRLPEVGRSLGRSMHDFRNAISGLEHDRSPDEVTRSTPPHPSATSAEAAAPDAATPAPAAEPSQTAATVPAETEASEPEPAEHVR